MKCYLIRRRRDGDVCMWYINDVTNQLIGHLIIIIQPGRFKSWDFGQHRLVGQKNLKSQMYVSRLYIWLS